MTGKEQIELQANLRKQGKHTSRGLRKDRQIPAVIYGPKIENLNVSISEIAAVKYGTTKFENTIFTLQSDDSKVNGLKVLRKEMVHHPLSRRPVHIDFYALDMTAKVKVNVELVFTGKAEGVREGGVLQEIRREVEVECQATDIPSNIEVDVTDLNIGDVIHASDLKMPSGATLITGEELSIVTVAEAAKEEEAAPAAEAAADGAPAEGDAAAPAAEGDAAGDKKE